ncbi:MAG: alpha/beta hydrolase, partial [Myxococcota bacterium]|nr:alpha/beta hydrolase [Myxococcota bacterium]
SSETRSDLSDESPGLDVDLDQDPVAACNYDNPFSQEAECREYFGPWSLDALDAACGAVFTGVAGVLTEDDACSAEGIIGTCVSRPDEQGLWFRIRHYGGDEEVTANACESFLDGTWESSGGASESTEEVELSPLEQALNSMKSNDMVTVVPECVDDSCLQTLTDATEGISFTPLGTEAPTSGFIFYPGAQVDPRAYAPVAQRIAAHGFLVVVVPMPGNFALNGWDRANAIIASRPDIAAWYLGGHSMGGAMSAHFAAEFPGVLSGLVLWAAYPGEMDDLSQSDLPVMSIYGANDGVATVEEIEATKGLLPPNTHYVELPGANHAQFGLYGEQAGDLVADIDSASQHQQVSASTTWFMAAGESPVSPAIWPGFAEADNAGWCLNAQKIIALDGAEEAPLPIVVETHDNTKEFGLSKSAIEAGTLQVQTFLNHHGNPGYLEAPPLLVRDVWCKLKTRWAIADALQTSPTGTDLSCADVNAAVVNWALTQVPEAAGQSYLTQAAPVVLDPDVEYETGVEWLEEGQLTIEYSETEGAVHIQSGSLKVGNDLEIPEAYRNVVYCKLVSPHEALRWVLTATPASDL